METKESPASRRSSLNLLGGLDVLVGMSQVAETGQRRGSDLPVRVAGGVLLAAAGGIHLDLYLTGYRSIPVIGWMFLLQVIVAFALAVLVVAVRSWVVSAAAAGFALATLGGYVLSIWVGLFGFREVRTTAGIVAGVIEVAAFAVLALASLRSLAETGPETGSETGPGSAAGRAAARLRQVSRAPVAAVGGVTVIALVVLGVAVGTAGGAGGAGGPAAGGAGSVRTATVGGVRVLTNSQGLTLYWFAPDTPAVSKCYSSCAAYWPPVRGPVTAGAGIPGMFGTISRTDGPAQATYNGHPLYAYIGDSAPGQANGNGLNLNGGLWHEVTVTG